MLLRPIGAANGAVVSQIIPVHLKSHFRRQMRVCQLAVAAQLILANAGIGADNLGRSYQCVRSWAPDSVSRGLRMLNRVYVKLRHQPLASVHVPVGAGWLRRLLALRPGSSVLCVPRGAPIAVENVPGIPSPSVNVEPLAKQPSPCGAEAMEQMMEQLGRAMERLVQISDVHMSTVRRLAVVEEEWEKDKQRLSDIALALRASMQL